MINIYGIIDILCDENAMSSWAYRYCFHNGKDVHVKKLITHPYFNFLFNLYIENNGVVKNRMFINSDV